MVNILGFVRAWEITDVSEQGFCLRVVVDAGGERNLKPELLANAITDYLRPVHIKDWDICRKKMFCQLDGEIQEGFC